MNIEQIVIERLQDQPSGEQTWDWAVFGDEEMLAHGDGPTLDEAVAALVLWLSQRALDGEKVP